MNNNIVKLMLGKWAIIFLAQWAAKRYIQKGN